ncbi:hypothetical protein Anas_04331, partial [Armadillidium nasatum]
VHNCSLGLFYEDVMSVPVLEKFSLNLYAKSLLLPKLWISSSQFKSEIFVETDQVTIFLSIPQIHLIYYLASSWFLESPSPDKLQQTSLIDDAIYATKKFEMLKFELQNLDFKFCQSNHLNAWYLSFGQLSFALCKANKDIISFIANGPDAYPNVGDASSSINEKLFRLSLQFPVNNEVGLPIIFSTQILKFTSVFNPQFLLCLRYSPKPRKDMLPWSLKLTNFQMYTLQSAGETMKLSVVEPVSTMATFAITPKSKGSSLSQLGVVIHLDMSSLDFRVCRRQVEMQVAILERFLNIFSFYVTFMSKDTSETLSSFSETCIERESIKGKKSFHEEFPSKTVEGKENVHKTLNFLNREESKVIEHTSTNSQKDYSIVKPSISDQFLNMTQGDAENSNDNYEDEMKTISEESKKLKAEIEDFTLGVDLHQIYSKIKCKIATIIMDLINCILVSPFLLTKLLSVASQISLRSKNILFWIFLSLFLNFQNERLHFNCPTFKKKKFEPSQHLLKFAEPSVNFVASRGKNLCYYDARRNSEWLKGEKGGVVLTVGDELTRDLLTLDSINRPPSDRPRVLNPTSISHSDKHPKSCGFLSLIITKAQCKNIHSRWNQMIKKHLRDERITCNKPCRSYRKNNNGIFKLCKLKGLKIAFTKYFNTRCLAKIYQKGLDLKQLVILEDLATFYLNYK